MVKENVFRIWKHKALRTGEKMRLKEEERRLWEKRKEKTIIEERKLLEIWCEENNLFSLVVPVFFHGWKLVEISTFIDRYLNLPLIDENWWAYELDLWSSWFNLSTSISCVSLAPIAAVFLLSVSSIVSHENWMFIDFSTPRHRYLLNLFG